MSLATMPWPSGWESGSRSSPSASASACSASARETPTTASARFPLGGYVKMSGENPMDERTGDPAEFLSHSRWHRFLIAIAGPTMNIMLAIFLLTSVYMVHYEYPVFMDKPAVIDGVRANSAAAQADLQAGRSHHQDRWHHQSHLGAGAAPGHDQPQPATRRHHPARRHGPRENHCSRSR